MFCSKFWTKFYTSPTSSTRSTIPHLAQVRASVRLCECTREYKHVCLCRAREWERECLSLASLINAHTGLIVRQCMPCQVCVHRKKERNHSNVDVMVAMSSVGDEVNSAPRDVNFHAWKIWQRSILVGWRNLLSNTPLPRMFNVGSKHSPSQSWHMKKY